jgi:hypothetical protein
MEAAACLVFRHYNEMGVFLGGFAFSSSNQLFASASHGGSFAGLLFFVFRYHILGVLGALFFSIITSGDFPLHHYNDKKSKGSRVHEFPSKKKNIDI